MDIAAFSINLNQASLGQSVNIALAKKAMENAQINNQEMLKALEAPHPTLGQTIDLKG